MASGWPTGSSVADAGRLWNDPAGVEVLTGLVYVDIDGVRVGCPVRTHDGSAWVDREVRVHNGAWVTSGAPA